MEVVATLFYDCSCTWLIIAGISAMYCYIMNYSLDSNLYFVGSLSYILYFFIHPQFADLNPLYQVNSNVSFRIYIDSNILTVYTKDNLIYLCNNKCFK